MATADSSNSYLILSEAVIYFDARLHSLPWDNAETEDHDRALIQATRLLDTYLVWHEIPDKTDPGQAIKDATCEMALVLLSGDTQVKDDLEGLESVGLKGMAIKAKGKKQVVPAHVYMIVSHLADRKNTGVIEIVRA